MVEHRPRGDTHDGRRGGARDCRAGCRCRVRTRRHSRGDDPGVGGPRLWLPRDLASSRGVGWARRRIARRRPACPGRRFPVEHPRDGAGDRRSGPVGNGLGMADTPGHTATRDGHRRRPAHWRGSAPRARCAGRGAHHSATDPQVPGRSDLPHRPRLDRRLHRVRVPAAAHERGHGNQLCLRQSSHRGPARHDDRRRDVHGAVGGGPTADPRRRGDRHAGAAWTTSGRSRSHLHGT